MDWFRDAVRESAAREEFFGPDGPCRVALQEGHPRLVLATGDNASGKSFFAKLVAAEAHGDGVEWIDLSMARRTRGGVERAMMFGDEGRESTGRVSSRTVFTGFDTCRQRTNRHVLFLDEPDYGLSDGFQSAMGEAIAAFAAGLPDATQGLLVVTHSRRVAGPLAALDPTCVRVGDDLRTTAEWLASADPPRSAADLEALGDVARSRSRAIQAVVDALAKERSSEATRR